MNPQPPSIGQTIADQIGRRAFLMMGAQHLMSDNRSLIFSIRGCKEINKIRVTLELDDTYKVDFLKIRGVECRTVQEMDGVYAENLNQAIEHTTGLALSL